MKPSSLHGLNGIAGLTDNASNNDVLRYQGDGLGDLFLGLVLVEGGAVAGDASTPLAGLFLVLVPLLLWAKRRFVAPRLSLADLEARRWSLRVRAFAWGGSAVALLFAAALVLRLAPPPARPWGLLCIAGTAIVAQIGLRTGTGRLVLYAVVAALLTTGRMVSGVPRLDAALGIVGALIAAVGCVLFIRFLRHHRPAAETHA